MLHYISELDTNRFGFKVAKINAFSEFDNNPQTAIEGLRKLDVKLVISRVPTSDVNLINKMEDIGFRLKDVQSTYNFDLDNNDVPSISGATCVYRGFKKDDIEDIARISAESFDKYGHYFNNEKTKLTGTSGIYEDWARRSCSNKDFADYIVVAEFEGAVAGFLSLKLHHDSQGKYAAGVMGAVSQDYRKHGIFQGINVASMRWAKNELLNRIENNVLVTNFPVNKTYVSLGFQIIRSEATLHCWLG